MRLFRAACLGFCVSIFCSAISFASAPDRIAGPVDSSRTVVLQAATHPKAQPQFDEGRVESSFPLNYVTLFTAPSASQQKVINRLLAEQQDPHSLNYHKWLTPEQYADRFGLSLHDLQSITTWLKGQGLSIVYVARGRNWVAFSGTAGQIEAAFHTEIHRYNENGEVHFANATQISIPAALAGVVVGFHGMDDFHPKPRVLHKTVPRSNPDYSDNNFVPPDFVAPGDIATIYDIDKLYNLPTAIDGTGEGVMVAGQTDVYLSDLNDFRSGFGFSQISCTTNSSGVITACNDPHFRYVLTGSDPGVSSGDLEESDLDLEWSGAVARNSQIIFVTSTDAFNSYLYAVDQNFAHVLSVSYGACEQSAASGNFISGSETVLAQGNLAGITIVNSSGDSGAAECDPPQNNPNETIATLGLAVSYPASSQYVTGAGGTAVTYPNGFTSTYWGTSNGTDGGSALSYVPETSWNDDAEFVPFCSANPSFCTWSTPLQVQDAIGMASSGGGFSNCATVNGSGVCQTGFTQPSWQTVTIPGQAQARFSPDISLLASPNFPGYIFCTELSELGDSGSGSSCAPGGAAGIANALDLAHISVIGGTSASAPVFSGMVALLNQYLSANGLSSGLGNVNPMLYKLAAASASQNAFHQVTSGNNQVYCSAGTPSLQPQGLRCPSTGTAIIGFQASNADATTGYNLVTGLGSVDTYNLAVDWAATITNFTLSASSPNPASVAAGGSATATVTMTPVNGFSSAVTYSCSTTGITCTFSPASTTTATSVQVTIQTSPSMATGNTTVTITGVSGSISNTTQVTLDVTATNESFSLASNVQSISVTQGQSGAATITMTPVNGFNAALTYSCTEPSNLTESSCTINPLGATTTNPVALTVTTTAPVSELRPPLGRRSRIFYAALLPGLLGIFFAAGSRNRGARGLRELAIVLILGCSALWIGSCSSTTKSSQNPGTPVGTYTLTVNATTGGANPITAASPVTITLNVGAQ